MKPFVIPEWRKKQIARKYRRKDQVIAQVCSEIDEAMKKAVDYVISHSHAGHYAEPPIDLDAICARFHIAVITAAFHACEDEKRSELATTHRDREEPEIRTLSGSRKTHLTKLAGSKGAAPLPPELEEVFTKKKFFRAIMARSKKLSGRLQRDYLKKLRKQFRKIMPLVIEGKASPAEVKKMMLDTWRGTRSRVETTFRTETTNYFGEAQVSFFKKDPDIIGFMFDSVRDSSRTDVCRSRHGLIYRPDSTGKTGLKYNTPALHYNCRSHLIALANTPANRKMMEDPGRDPDRVKVVDLKAGWKKK